MTDHTRDARGAMTDAKRDSINSPFNACCNREACRALLAQSSAKTDDEIYDLFEKETGFSVESHATIEEADILGFARALLAAPRAQFDAEALIRECVPGGSICDPQAVADAIRAYAAPRQPGEMADAYVGAREDLAIWKKRALESSSAPAPQELAMQTELKPCPWCGDATAFVERADYSSCYVHCNGCGAHGPIGEDTTADNSEEVPGYAQAAELWNRRELESSVDSLSATLSNVDKAVRETLGIDPSADDALPELVADWLESASQHGGGEALPTTGQLTALLPGVYYMDPPDGGSVTLLEQLQRMASDAARYLLLRRKVCIVDSKFHIINIEPTYIGPDAGIELDASIDFALRAAPSAGNGGAEGDSNGR